MANSFVSKFVLSSLMTVASAAHASAVKEAVLTGGFTYNDTVTVNAPAGAPAVIANGSVGIGTATPSMPLDVMGPMAIQGNSSFIWNRALLYSIDRSTSPVGRTYTMGSREGTFTVSDETAGVVAFRINANQGFSMGGYGANGTLTPPAHGMILPGRLGVGTYAPAASVHVAGAGTSTSFGRFDTNLRLETDTTIANAGSEISFQGSSTATNGIYAAISAPVNVNDGNGAEGALVFSTKLQKSTSLFEAMRITRDGNIGMGVGAPSEKLDIRGYINSSSGLKIANTVICSSSGCVSPSDLRLKKDIRPLTGSLEKVERLQGVSYNWKNEATFGEKTQIGLIAQDVETVIPEVVVTDRETGMKAVAYDHLTATLIEAVKELSLKNKQLVDRVETLERRLDTGHRE